MRRGRSSKSFRRLSRRQFKGRYHKGGVRRAMRKSRRRHNARPQFVRVSRGGERM